MSTSIKVVVFLEPSSKADGVGTIESAEDMLWIENKKLEEQVEKLNKSRRKFSIGVSSMIPQSPSTPKTLLNDLIGTLPTSNPMSAAGVFNFDEVIEAGVSKQKFSTSILDAVKFSVECKHNLCVASLGTKSTFIGAETEKLEAIVSKVFSLSPLSVEVSLSVITEEGIMEISMEDGTLGMKSERGLKQVEELAYLSFQSVRQVVHRVHLALQTCGKVNSHVRLVSLRVKKGEEEAASHLYVAEMNSSHELLTHLSLFMASRKRRGEKLMDNIFSLFFEKGCMTVFTSTLDKTVKDAKLTSSILEICDRMRGISTKHFANKRLTPLKKVLRVSSSPQEEKNSFDSKPSPQSPSAFLLQSSTTSSKSTQTPNKSSNEKNSILADNKNPSTPLSLHTKNQSPATPIPLSTLVKDSNFESPMVTNIPKKKKADTPIPRADKTIYIKGNRMSEIAHQEETTFSIPSLEEEISQVKSEMERRHKAELERKEKAHRRELDSYLSAFHKKQMEMDYSAKKQAAHLRLLNRKLEAKREEERRREVRERGEKAEQNSLKASHELLLAKVNLVRAHKAALQFDLKMKSSILEGKLFFAKEALLQSETTKKMLESQLEKVRSEGAELGVDISCLKSQLEDTRKALLKSEESLKNKEKQLDSLQDQLGRQVEEKKRLERKMEEISSGVEDNPGEELEEVRKQLKAKEKQVIATKRQMEKLKEKLEKDKAFENKISSLEEQLSEKERLHSLTERKRKEKEEEMENLKRKFEELKEGKKGIRNRRASIVEETQKRLSLLDISDKHLEEEVEEEERKAAEEKRARKEREAKKKEAETKKRERSAKKNEEEEPPKKKRGRKAKKEEEEEEEYKPEEEIPKKSAPKTVLEEKAATKKRERAKKVSEQAGEKKTKKLKKSVEKVEEDMFAPKQIEQVEKPSKGKATTKKAAAKRRVSFAKQNKKKENEREGEEKENDSKSSNTISYVPPQKKAVKKPLFDIKPFKKIGGSALLFKAIGNFTAPKLKN